MSHAPSPSLQGLFSLDGKTALVVGGYGGLGGAIARGLVGCGARVAIAGRRADKAEAFAAELESGAVGLALDANDLADIDRGVGVAAAALGHIDILMNCVGINIEETLLEATEAAFDKVYSANLKAAMFLAQAVARLQVEGGRGGRHIHMLSVSAHRGILGRGYSAYCSTKAAQIMLVRQHALELAEYDVQVNGVAPTYVVTDMIERKMADPTVRAQMEATIPAGRIPYPADIVGTAVFLASPAAGFVTGQVIYVDGGVSARR